MADEQLSAELDLSIESALSAVDTLSTTLTSSLDESASSFSDSLSAALDAASGITVPVDADASAIPAEIEDTAATVGVSVPVDADTTEATAELEQLAAAAPVIVAEVDADTTDAQAALDDLGAAGAGVSTGLQQASQSTHSLGESAGFAAAGAELATGNVKGLAGEVGGLSSGLGATVGVGAAAAASIGEIANKGIEAAGASQRFHAILGPMADTLEHIDVGNLNVGLGELANKLGDTKSQMENAAATTFQFATNSGASKEASAQFSETLIGLASRAVSLNPALGSVSDVAESMSTRLARGGRFAASFGVSLTSAEINARALGDTGKTAASDLTIYEKSAAAAELATAKYGGQLSQTVETGSKNAIIQQRALKASFDEVLEAIGRPLVIPLFDAIRAGIPDFQAFGQALGSLAQAGLPVLTSALQAVTPALQLIADVLSALAPVIPPVVEGFIAFEVVSSVAEGVQALGVALGLLPGEALSAAAAQVALAGATELSSEAMLAEAVASEAAFGPSLPVILGVAAAVGVASLAFGVFDSSAQKVTDSMHKASAAFDELTGKDLVSQFDKATHSMDVWRLESISPTTVGLQQFKAVAEENVGTAQRLLDALNAAGRDTKGYQDVLDKAVGSEKESKKAKEESKAATDALVGSQDTAAQSTTNATTKVVTLATAYSTAAQAQSDYAGGTAGASDAISALNTAASTLKDTFDLLSGGFVSSASAQIGYQDAADKLTASLFATGGEVNGLTEKGRENERSMLGLVTAAESWSSAIISTGGSATEAQVPFQLLRGQLQKIRDELAAGGGDTTFIDSLLASVDKGIAGVQAKTPEAEAAGVAIGGAGAAGVQSTVPTWGQYGFDAGLAFATGTASTAPDTSGAGTTVGTAGVEGLSETVPAWLQAGLNAGMAGALGAGSTAPAHAAAGQQAGQAGAGGVASTAPAHQAAGQGVGQAATTGLGEGMAGMPGVAQGSVFDSVNAAALAGANAHNVGYGIGTHFAEGIHDGITADTSYVASAAASIVQAAKTAADRKANSASPSKLFMEVGSDIAAGMALGIESGTADVTRAMSGLVTPPPTPASSGVSLSNASIQQLAQAITVNTGPPRGGGGLTIQNATFGTQDVLADLDWFARTRMAGV